ncbi:hypothetical protein GCM10023231_35260 [Olivibacter ginsenosidimutans]|uniref:FtsX-like permease family protein n=1 Tax=Olivibacter ginsenosidimutans TaxID=1176537 RepID=A0ABP9C2P4_9SPHI
MLKNYFKIAWRNLVREKGYSFINISGLALGIAGATFILLWALHEKSYDRFFSNSDRIYQLWSQLPVDDKIFSFEYSPEVLASSLQKNIPEIETATSYVPIPAVSYAYRDKKLNLATAIVDSSFFKVFDFDFAQGDPTSFFQNPTTAILTESAAIMIFGTTDIIGKTIELTDRQLLNVSAILKDLPSNTEFNFKILLPWNLGKRLGHVSDQWDSFEAETFILTREHAHTAIWTQKISSFMHPYKTDVAIDLYPLPLAKRHLQANFENGKRSGGKIVLVNSFILVAILLLSIACINFMNLSTAKSEKRAIEVGIRKVTGASRISLISQFLSEAIILTSCSGTLALLLIFLLHPFFNDLTGQQIYLPLKEYWFWLSYVTFVLFTGLLAGSYPAFLLSSFRPVQTLKGSFLSLKSGLSIRKILCIIQFTGAIILIIGTSVIYQQIDHAQNRKSGYDRSRLIYTSLSAIQQRNYPAIKQKLLTDGIASSISKTFAPVTDPNAIGNGYTWEGFSGTGTSSTLFVTFATEADLLKPPEYSYWMAAI